MVTIHGPVGSLAEGAAARAATGYERGTITPFGSLPSPSGTPWPVIADALVASRPGPVSIGAGAHGVAASVEPAALIAALGTQVADVTDPL